MIKGRVTKSEVLNGYKNVIKIGYCNLQNLLNYERPYAYTEGTYGWNADIYEVDYNTAIVTGCRPFGNVNPSYELCAKYDTEALGKSKEERRELIKEFVREVLEA